MSVKPDGSSFGTRQAYLSLLMYGALCAAAIGGGVVEVIEEPNAVVVVTLCVLTGVGFWALLASGLSRSLSADRSLTAAQCYAAQGVCGIAYLCMGPVRAGVLLPALTTLVFALFGLQPSQVRSVAYTSVAFIGAAMVFGVLTLQRDPRVEALSFVLLASYMAGVTTLSARMSSMREKMRSDNLRLEEAVARVELLATTDELTGLWNRRHAVALIDHELRLSHRNRNPICVALIDIDHFKNVNDTFGHSSGDQVLKSVAAALLQATRITDICSRWGGEEFLVVFPNTSLNQALAVLARIRQEVAEMDLRSIDPQLRISFSAGLASLRPGEAQAAAVNRADGLMYRAKRTGRDRAVCES